MLRSLVGSEMCIRDRIVRHARQVRSWTTVEPSSGVLLDDCLCAWLHVHVWTLHAECGDVWWLSDRQILDGDGLCQLHVVRGRWAESCCCKQYCALNAVVSCGRKRDSSAGVRHTKVMASCMRSEAERPRLALTMLTVAGRQLLGCQRCFLLP